MTDFSDKYKKALEYQELSPDFKERTAKLMSELRDADAPVPKTADENDNAVSPVIVSESDGAKTDRTKFIKIISTAAAAAACLTVAFALNRAGFLDKDSETSLAAADGISTEVTDLIEAEDEENISESEYSTALYENPAEEAFDEIPEMVADDAEAETTAVEAAETAALSESSAVTTTFAETTVSDADTIVTEAKAKKESNAPDTFISANSSDTAVAEEEKLPLETVLILEPFSEENSEEAYENESDEGTEYESPVTDDISVPNAARASSFSPKNAVEEFPAQNITAVITPSFEDIDPENGNVVTYEPRQVRSVSKLLTLSKELYDFSDNEASYSSEAPADSRYIIDYTDKQGNALRIFMGSRYICFEQDGCYYTFDLTEDEYRELDSTLFGLIS